MRRRLHHVRLAYGHLICVWQRVCFSERIKQIFLLAQALRETRACLFAPNVFHRLDSLQRTDLCAQFLLLFFAQIILHIDADLYL